MAKLADPAPPIDSSYSNQHDFTCDNGAPAGAFVVLRGMINDDTVTVTGAADTQGNTYAIDITMASGSGNTVFIITSKLDNPLSNGDIISIYLDNGWIMTATCTAYDNVVTSPFDWGTGQASNASLPWSSGTVPPTTYANELLIGVSAATNFTSSVPDTGWSEEDDFNSGITSNTLVTQYQIVTVSNSYENSGTWDATSDFVACICTYQMTPSGGGPATPDRPQGPKTGTIIHGGKIHGGFFHGR